MLYVEDMNGEPVSGNTAAEIRRMARGLWKDLLQWGHASPQWGKLGYTVRTWYERKMEAKHQELHLCSDHWKVNYIATQIYPSWIRQQHKDSDDKTEKLDATQAPVKKRLKSAAPEDSEATNIVASTVSSTNDMAHDVMHNNMESPRTSSIPIINILASVELPRATSPTPPDVETQDISIDNTAPSHTTSGGD
ncbi:hypothetical protein BJV78DRAFT_1290244 [Lactifluus subvellereus]|nr:hypothetical protein BJV78DRAFT_1290244 [Lactifluus subvellereus]